MVMGPDKEIEVFKKIPHWETALMKLIQDVLGEPFEWGVMDCAILAASCHDAMTGTKIVEGILNKYDSEKTAYKFHKGLSVESYLLEHEAIIIKPNYESVGDFIIFDTENSIKTVGVYLGQKCLIIDLIMGVMVSYFESLPAIKKIYRISI